MADKDRDLLTRLWGKIDKKIKDPDEFHPALYHMLDVGNVANIFLTDPRVSPRWRNALSLPFNSSPGKLINWIPYFVAMHDIGKISAAFQGKDGEQRKRLLTEGFTFDGWEFENDLAHNQISLDFVENNHDGIDMPDLLRHAWKEMLGGHHGYFVSPQEVSSSHALLQIREPEIWRETRLAVSRLLAEALLHDVDLPNPSNLSTAIMTLTGFAILCDWLGSNSDFFRPSSGVKYKDYVSMSRNSATHVVEWAGFCQVAYSSIPPAFTGVFRTIAKPRQLQIAIDEIPDDILKSPCLAIIEAPTGEGKTEAALALAHRLAHYSKTDEFFYALPTTATSNQMFRRVHNYLANLLRLETKARLVHGQAFLTEDDLQFAPLVNGDRKGASDSLEWFAPRKRSLLAPFGVGTIDQAELAALNVRHVALRLLGLAGKVVILDEVHAYDTYMSVIVERLLEWLSAMGTSVILLSATLPMSRKVALAQAFGLADTTGVPSSYPSLWISSTNKEYYTSPASSYPGRHLEIATNLHFHEDEFENKANWLLDIVASGGCACWITNTVERAQNIFESLDKIKSDEVDCMLVHARFPFQQRQNIEKLLVEKYGLDGKRPKRGIVIGTQVLEQSLDLDFDVMVSDLAPVDLLLQRAGRLHRHRRTRPALHAHPCLWINTPISDPEEDFLGVDVYIYDEYILRRTWQALDKRNSITLPEDYRRLVEFVYKDDRPNPNDRLYGAWDNLDRNRAIEIEKAKLRILPEPSRRRSFVASVSKANFLEDETGTAWIVAQTRLGEETVTVIPMVKLSAGEAALWGSNLRMSLNEGASRNEQLAMLRQSIRVGKVVEEIKSQALPKLFLESPLLKNSYPIWLENGKSRMHTHYGNLVMTLDEKLGLVLKKGE